MIAEAISEKLTTHIVGRPVRVYQELTSTNDFAMQLGNDDAPEGFAIFAETQTQGRGRLGRSWQSTRGDSLAFSVLLRPRWCETSRLSLVAAVAVVNVLDRLTTRKVGIKWPNDVYIEGKKIAGILCEGGRDFIVVGIGLNVFQKQEDFPPEIADRAGSVAMFSEESPRRVALASSLLNELDRLYHTLPESFAEIIAECERRSVLLDQPVEIELGDTRLSGVVTGLDTSGGLVIRDAAGNRAVISAGEVTLLKT